jgi:diguanylate cyclase (GGDEF)-like protein/PAS domain S-box-containing protein
VLIIEDSEDDAELILRELRRGGFEPRAERVERAADLRASLAGATWQIALSDHLLPGMDSTEVLDIFAELAPDVPVIVISGAIGEEAAVAALRRGAADYVRKDHLERLGPAIRHTMREGEVRREARTAREALEQSEWRFRQLVERIPAVVYTAEVGPEGRWRFVSPQIEHLLGYTPEEWYSDPSLWAERMHPEDRPGVLARESEETLLGDEYRLLHRDGHVVWVSDDATLERDPDGTRYWRGVLTDITERKRVESQLRFLADHDPLTGLANRRRFLDAISRQLQLALRYGPGGAVLILDLDGFKRINDTMGHHAGDEALRSVSAVLQRRLRSTDVLARLGGDEFGVLLPYAARPEAERVAEALLRCVRDNPLLSEGQHTRLSTSIGVALFGQGDRELTADGLLASADLALYEAKKRGRDRYEIHLETGDREAGAEERHSWPDRIRKALAEDALVLHLQPIVDVPSGKLLHHEALLRIRDDNGELIMPGAFMGAAERSGLIRALDKWVIRRAAELVAGHRAAGSEIRLEVNLSGVSIGDAELPGVIEAAIATNSIPPSSLIFEVSETAAIQNMADAAKFARRLNEIGCAFALDDFGAGFGSFYYLKYLPVDYLKIDGEFIRNLAASRMDQVLVRGMVAVAQGLGVKTIAEYVGDEATLGLLRDYGVDHAQGFHVGKPKPAPERRFRSPSAPAPRPVSRP